MTKTAKIIIAVLAALLFVSLLANLLFLQKDRTPNNYLGLNDISNLEISNSDYNYVREYEVLLRVKDSLDMLLTKKDKELSSKETELKNIKKKLEENNIAQAKAEASNEVANNEENIVDEESPKAIAEAIIYRLIQMRDNTAQISSQELTKIKNLHRNKAIELLTKLNEKTKKKFNTTISKIINNLTDKKQEAVPMNVDKRNSKDHLFHSTAGAVNKINELINDIKKEILKNL